MNKIVHKHKSFSHKTLRSVSMLIALLHIGWTEMLHASFVIEPGETLTVNDRETLRIAGDMNISDNASLNAGAVAVIRVTGDWNNRGNFNAHGSTVYFSGAGTTTTIAGENAFYNLYVDHDDADTRHKALVFVPGATQAVSNRLRIRGDADALITLRSSSPGTQYHAFDIGAATSVDVSYVDVQDAVASNGVIYPVSSVDSGNSTGWFTQDRFGSAGMYPANNSVLVAAGSSYLSLRFSTDVAAEAGKFLRVFRSDGTLVRTVAIDDASNVRVDGNVVVIDLDDLAADTGFHVELDDGAFVTIGAGIRSNAISDAVTWSFNTAPHDYAGERSLKLGEGIVPLDEVSASALDPDNDGNQDDSLIAGLVAAIDPDQRDRGYQLFAGETDGSRVTHRLDVRGGDGRLQAYLDTSMPADGIPDLLWDPDANTLERVNLHITHAQDAENRSFEVSDSVGLSLADTNAATLASATPGLSGTSDDADHPFRVWGYSGGELQPVTGWISADGDDWKVTAADYIRPLDTGDNLAFLRGSASLPLALTSPASVRLTKTANRKEISVGGIVTYAIAVENLTQVELASVHIVDDIPPGFKYVEGSARLDDVSLEPGGRGTGVLTFELGALQPGSGNTSTLRYQLVVGTGVDVGRYKNTAVATMPGGEIGSALSLPDDAEVEVVPDTLFDLATIIGKVFHDRNANGYQDAGEPPVPYARIVTADGRQITTDVDGRYHVAGALPGRHLLRLDERSLPAGSTLTTRKTRIVNVRPGLPAKANFGVLTNAGDGAPLNIQVLSDEPRPRLSVALSGPATLNAQSTGLQSPLKFRLFSNYSAYFERWELDIFEPVSERVIARRTGTRDDFFLPVLWNGEELEIADLKPGRTLSYRLRVSDAQGRSDTTADKQLRLAAFDGHEAHAPLSDSRPSWDENHGEQNDRREIPVRGQTVRIYGEGFDGIRVIGDNGSSLTVPAFAGPLSAADVLLRKATLAQGELPRAELILPSGHVRVETLASVRVGLSRENAEHNTEDTGASWNLPHPDQAVVGSRFVTIGPGGNSDESDLFLVALADGEIGYREVDDDFETATSGDSRFEDRVWKDGKIAVYLKGTIRGKYLITASYDSERGDEDLFRQLDPDELYPVYGDGSITEDLTREADGKLYLLLERSHSSLKWGRYSTALTETELARFQRNLHGAMLHYRSEDKTSHGEAKTTVIGFNAGARQKASHNEFQATGGSLYYLKNRDIVADSLQLRIQVRDRITGDVIDSTVLVPEADYELDASAGRITFWQPVDRYVDSGLLTSADVDNRNLVYIVADYSYFVIDSLDLGVSGGRIERALTDAISLGITHVEEDRNATRYTLKGLDSTVHLGKDASVTLEYAETRGQGVAHFVSTDGGHSWGIEEPVDTQEGSDGGRAWSVRGDVNLLNDRLNLDYYYRYVEDDFSISATDHEPGKQGAGFDLSYGLTDNIGIRYRHDSQWLIDIGSQEAQLQVGGAEKHTDILQLQHEDNRLTLIGEYRHQAIVRDTGDRDDTESSTDLLAVKGIYRWNDTTEFSAGQQIGLEDESNNQTSISIRKQLTETLNLGGTVITGNEDTAYQIDVGYRLAKTLSLTGGLGQDSDGSSLMLGGAYQPDDQQTYRASFSTVHDRDKDARNDLLFGVTRQLDNGFSLDWSSRLGLGDKLHRIANDLCARYAWDEEREVYANLSRYEQQEAHASGNGREIEIGGDLTGNWAGFVKAGQGYVHRLDGERDRRNNHALGLAYVRHKPDGRNPLIQARFLMETISDRGASNRDDQRVQLDVNGQLNRNWSLFTKVDWGRSVDNDTGSEDARNNRFDLGLAYRPVDHDTVNLIGKYSRVDDQAPEGQDSISGLRADKAHVFATDVLWQISHSWQLGGKLAYRLGEEKIEFLPWATTETWLAASQVAYRFRDANRVSLEWRRLRQEQATDSKDGIVLEYSRRFSDYLEVSAGYNFAGFNDDLGGLDYTMKGFYIRTTAALGED